WEKRKRLLEAPGDVNQGPPARAYSHRSPGKTVSHSQERLYHQKPTFGRRGWGTRKSLRSCTRSRAKTARDWGHAVSRRGKHRRYALSASGLIWRARPQEPNQTAGPAYPDTRWPPRVDRASL